MTAPGTLGLLHTLVAVGLYAAVMIFVGGSLLRAAPAQKGRTGWPMPAAAEATPDPNAGTAWVWRERSLVLDAGLVAILLAAALALLDARNAAGSFAPAAMHRFLLSGAPGLARLSLVGLLAAAWVGALVAPPAGAAAAVLALAALVAAGSDLSAFPMLALGWVRLMAVSVLVATIATASWGWRHSLRPVGGRPSRSRPPALRTQLGRSGLPALLVAAGTTVAIALLPREVPASSALASAPTLACSPCAPPLPAGDQLAVATTVDRDVVAGWLRRRAGGLDVELRVLDAQGAPAHLPITLPGAAPPSSCGPGCLHFARVGAAGQLRVLAHTRAGPVAATLPVRWQPAASAAAREILDGAQATMRRLTSVRELEVATSAPGLYALTDSRLQAPDRLSSTTHVVRPPQRPVLESQQIEIAGRTWMRTPGSAWQRQPPDGGLPFRTASWFTWTNDSAAVRLLSISGAGHRGIATLALMDPGTPAWWTLRIALGSRRVLWARLITPGESATYRYSQFDRAPPIPAPRGGRP